MARYYIFEDDERDDIQKLFYFPYQSPVNQTTPHQTVSNKSTVNQVATKNVVIKIKNTNKKRNSDKINKHIKDKLWWVGGAGKIIPAIKSLSKKSEIYVFMDLVPDNRETANLYRDIRMLRKEGYDILVFPIPCAEYYMIKVLCDLGIQSRTPDIDIVLKRGVYYNSSILDNPQSKEHIKNFETFCKVVLSKMGMMCACKSNEKDRELNNLKGRFYRADCQCTACNFRYSMQQKAEKLLSIYRCFPPGAYVIYYKIRKYSRNDCIAIHREMVDEYNLIVDNYRKYNGPSKLAIRKSKRDFSPIKYFQQ